MIKKRRKTIILLTFILCSTLIVAYILFRSYFPKVIYNVDKENFLNNKTAYETIAKMCYEHHLERNSEMSVYRIHLDKEYIAYFSRIGDENGEDKIRLFDEQLQCAETVCNSYHLDDDYLLQIEIYDGCVFFCNMTRRAYLVYSASGKKPRYVYFNKKEYDNMLVNKMTDNWYMIQISL